jgi:pimeloyl-ACP methyl ester carboxylesterase
VGRQADALGAYQDYRDRLAEELGLEPSPSLQQLQAQVLRQQLPQHQDPGAGTAASPSGLAGLEVRYLALPDGQAIASGTVGGGPRLVVLPSWVTSLEVIASGRDPRSSLLERLAARLSLVLYDRRGTGLSGGQVTDFGLAPAVAELRAVLERTGGPASLLAMSQAGPVALALAAERPELVERLVLFGTYAAGPATFTNPELQRLLVAMVRAHWGMGSRLVADLYRPDASDEAARHMAQVLRDSGDREVAAGYLEAVYQADVAALLPRVQAPALVLHYRGDRVIPFHGGRQLAAALPGAAFLPLDGAWHLPDAADLDRVVAAVVGFLGG